MNTPIYDFVSKYIENDPVRFHMPGHKSSEFLGCEKRDITEIEGADFLYGAKGIIAESEENAGKLFGTGSTFFSVEGSSQVIKAMIYLSAQNTKNGEKLILAGRNAHRSFIQACGLIGCDVEWLYPENFDSLCSCEISRIQIENKLKQLKKSGRTPCCVYVTSPDYLGNLADIKGFSEVCVKFNVPLIVDNAHGSYLKFLNNSVHPIDLGADMCCDSAHKTLTALTGAAYLHISKNSKFNFSDNAKHALEIFGSTSPSYLILQSLDLCNDYLDKIENKFDCAAEKVGRLKEKIKGLGFEIVNSEPLKLTIKPKSFGYTGYEIEKILNKDNIFTEYSDPDFLVMMFSPENRNSDYEKLFNSLSKIKRKSPIETCIPDFIPPEKKMTVREGMFSNSVDVELNEADGLITSCPTVSCPPCIAVSVSGEKINKNTIDICRYYSIDKLNVVK